MRRVWLSVLAVIALLSAPTSFGPAAGQTRDAAPRAPERQILFLSSYHLGLPVPDGVTQGMLAAAREGGVSVGNLFHENLDLIRTPSAEYRADLLQMLRHKLAGTHIGVIIAEGPPAIKFMAEEGKDLFPNAPLLTLITPDNTIPAASGRKTMTIPWRHDPAGTLKVAMELFPTTRRVLVVSGFKDGVLPFLDDAKKAFASWTERLEFQYTNNLTYEEMLRQVASQPPDSIILYAPYFTDSTGRSFVPAEVVLDVRRAANAPIFSTLDAYLGHGIIGGSLIRTDLLGRQAGNIALDYLNGRLRLSEPVTKFAMPSAIMLDWQELARWGDDPERRPEGSTIINRPITLWSQYKVTVIITTASFLILTILIAALLAMNRRQKQMQTELCRHKDFLEEMVHERTQALEDSERFLRTVADNIPGLVGYWDPALRCRFANRHYLEWFGRTAEAMVDIPVSELLGENLFALNEPYMRAALAGEAQFFEREIPKPSGEIGQAWVQYIPDQDASGQVRGFLVVTSDITRIKQTERALRELNIELTLAKDKADAANRAKSQFLASMSHELRTPLTSVIGFSQLMADDKRLNSDQLGKLATINRSGTHLLTLINDVLELSKIEAGRLTLDKQPTNPGDLLDAVVEMLRPRAEQKGLTFELHSTGLPPGIVADAAKLRQVLLNLLSNAIKFTEQGQIDLEVAATEAEPGLVRLDIAVTDTGLGISVEDQQRVFEPFEQTSTANKQVGTGLGLSISRQYVRMMGGELVVESRPGQGSTFQFGFTVAVCEAPNVRVIPSGKVIGVEPGSGSRRILVAEDTLDIRLLLRTLLAPLDFTVIEVTDGAAALASVQQDPPDLVIMDWRMPELDGVEATKRIRALDTIRQPRIVILTASAYEEQRLITLAAGADDFLRKPFEQSDFYALLERQLGARFLREDRGAIGEPPPTGMAELTSGDLAVLSPDLRAALTEAVREMNATKMSECFIRITRDHPGVAPGLKAMVDDAKVIELHQLLEGLPP